MAAAAGGAAVPSIGLPSISAATLALRSGTPTMHGGAIMAGVVISAMENDSGIATSTVGTIVGSAALSVMVFPIMTIMDTTPGDALGYIAERSSPAAPIGGTGITPASIIIIESHYGATRKGCRRRCPRGSGGAVSTTTRRKLPAKVAKKLRHAD
jgi:hypothetical protein